LFQAPNHVTTVEWGGTQNTIRLLILLMVLWAIVLTMMAPDADAEGTVFWIEDGHGGRAAAQRQCGRPDWDYQVSVGGLVPEEIDLTHNVAAGREGAKQGEQFALQQCPLRLSKDIGPMHPSEVTVHLYQNKRLAIKYIARWIRESPDFQYKVENHEGAFLQTVFSREGSIVIVREWHHDAAERQHGQDMIVLQQREREEWERRDHERMQERARIAQQVQHEAKQRLQNLMQAHRVSVPFRTVQAAHTFLINPFAYEGKNIARLAYLTTMLSPTEGVFMMPRPLEGQPFIVSNIPRGFAASPGMMVVAGGVVGKTTVKTTMGRELLVPHLKFLSVHSCHDVDCSEFERE
jgi:hypothetical protein